MVNDLMQNLLDTGFGEVGDLAGDSAGGIGIGGLFRGDLGIVILAPPPHAVAHAIAISGALRIGIVADAIFVITVERIIGNLGMGRARQQQNS